MRLQHFSLEDEECGNFEAKEEEERDGEQIRPFLPGQKRSVRCSAARLPHERWGRKGSYPDGTYIS